MDPHKIFLVIVKFCVWSKFYDKEIKATNKKGKEARKKANIHANNKNKQTQVENIGRMACSIVTGDVSMTSYSGEVARDWCKELHKYHGDFPWNRLSPEEPRPFTACAEAALWLKLKARGKKPKNYTIAAYNTKGHLTAPCKNCALWVGKAFGGVVSKTTKYAGHNQQVP